MMEGPRILSRNRTPWDAGGYSLPITTRPTTSPPVSQQQRNPYEEGQISSPTSPRHNLSDSRSSISSLMSSMQSTAHSRLSSTSTASFSRSIDGIVSEILSPNSVPLNLPSPVDGYHPDEPNSGAHYSVNTHSISQNLESLGTTTDNLLLPWPEQVSKEDKKRSNTALTPPPRLSSPSDAILIKRIVIPSSRLDTEGHEISRIDFHLQL
jgi:hypothetical protein